MKNLLIILALLLAGTSFAQEWGTVKGNKVTLKEVGPIWPGCEKEGANKDNCFNQKLSQHVMSTVRYPAEEYKKNIQGEVIVVFDINTSGEVEIKDVSGGNPGLQKEARRVIGSIPKMSAPGMYAGKPRAIEYTVPINFKTGK